MDIQPNGWYKLDYIIEQDGHTFTDAIWFTPEQLTKNISSADLDVIKQARFAAWLAAITAPPVEELIQPTSED